MLMAKQDEAGVILIDEQNDFLCADASRLEEIEDLSANICLMARIQPTNNTFDAETSYDYAFISEVQSSSINDNKEQMYPTHTKIIDSTIGDDQIDSNIIFDTPNGNVNSDSVEKDTHVPDLYALEQLARNAYQPFKIAFLELIRLIIVSSHRYPILVLVVMPLYNLEFSDSDDSSLRIHIASRLLVNSKTVELVMFTPPMGDSPEGMLVIAYRLFNSHCPRHQVFYPLDMPIICFLRLLDRSSILAA
nr:hypothetical protein [Tanacetum cinerariifolium]